MSEGHTQDHEHAHEHAAPVAAPFRFESFGDAPSAQAAFEALYPPGSSIEPALRTLVDMGAQCKAVTPVRLACRYVENQGPLGGFCWQIALERDSENAIQRASIALGVLGV
jgi:hypothetical protein